MLRQKNKRPAKKRSANLPEEVSGMVEAMRVSLILRTLNISKIGHSDFTLFLGV